MRLIKKSAGTDVGKGCAVRIATAPHFPQQLLALRRPADARLNIGKLCTNFRSGLPFHPAESRVARISAAR
jgi:hypothetical protein